MRERRKFHRVAARLLEWYAGEARDLPWRRSRDAYGIWVSEVMLQQTRVAAVVPYWERWMGRLPTVGALARAREGTVLKLWAGLGYYSRARNLQRAAREIVKNHGGKIPRDVEVLKELPGVGRYTAGAVASIAFNGPEPVVDGNVARVLSRLFAVAGDPKSGEANRRLWKLAGELVRTTDRCGDLNQALMELGAVVCQPRGARCGGCPLKRLCVARRRGAVGEFPRTAKRAAVVACDWRVLVLEHRGQFLVRQRPRGGVNAGLWEFPTLELAGGRAPCDWVSSLAGLPVGTAERLAVLTHHILNRRIRIEAWHAACNGSRPVGHWRTLGKLAGLALAGAHRKVLARLQAGIATGDDSC